MGKMKLFGHMWIDRNLTEVEIRKLCGLYVLGLPNLEDYRYNMEVTPIKESAIQCMAIPDVPILKMTKQQYVDDFFGTGRLQLGSFEYYSRYDHGEIGDREEGEVVLVAEGNNFTAAGKYAGGFDNYLLCTYLGEPDPETLEKFGYDGGFIIKDPERFAMAIQKALGALSHEYANCAYNPHKAIRGKMQPGFTIERIDHRTIEMISTARHFIKPDRFAHQREFRFTWKMPHDVNDPYMIECPEAIQYCERIAT